MKIAPYYIATEHSVFCNNIYIESSYSKFNAEKVAKNRLKKLPFGQSILFSTLTQLKTFIKENKTHNFQILRS